MYYQVISFTHKNCEQTMREKIAFSSDEEKIDMINKLVHFDFIDEAFIVSTCNRVEVVLATSDNFSSYHSTLGLISKKSMLDFYDIKEVGQIYDDEDAVKHIFSVVSSLDSLVVGESQITGQVKDAFILSHKNGTAGPKLNRIISYAVKCAAEVRNATNISQNPISIASVAVAKAHQVLGDNMAGSTAIVIGLGEMGILTTKHLLREGCDVILVGRDFKKTKLLAQSLGENVTPNTIDKISKCLNRYRLLFTATSSKEPIIKRELIENETLQRLWFDIALPRDIDDIKLDKLEIFRIDDLRDISKSNYAIREEQAILASDIVNKYTDDFFAWLRALSIEPIIKQMREQVYDSIDVEMKRALKKGFIPKDLEDNIRKMAEQMFKRFLHKPTQNLRESSTNNKNSNCSDAIINLFNIDVEHIDAKQYKSDHHKKGYNS